MPLRQRKGRPEQGTLRVSALLARRGLVCGIALLLIAQVIRNAAVQAFGPLKPAVAARFWPGHPDVEISKGLVEIAAGARARNEVAPATFALIADAAAKAPLSPEPYLVRGVQAQTSGDMEAARRAFRQAQWRDPRSVPAAYFLADYYVRSGHAFDGLRQIALLSRLMPATTEPIAPFIATYARNPSNWPQIRQLFRDEQNLQYGVLAVLAQDPGNADAILAVADAEHRKPDSAWLPILLNSLVKKGDYQKAHEIWASIGRARPSGGGIYDAALSSPQAPPPFNWSFATSTVGLAERQPGKRMHVIFYGNEDGVLASQLLLLQPGAYRFQMRIAGGPSNPELLSWSVRCNNSTEPFASIGIVQAAARGWAFQVPASCPAQWIELTGRSGDIAQQADVAIGDLSLTRAGPNV